LPKITTKKQENYNQKANKINSASATKKPPLRANARKKKRPCPPQRAKKRPKIAPKKIKTKKPKISIKSVVEIIIENQKNAPKIIRKIQAKTP